MLQPSTELVTTKVFPYINPIGKGGFGDNPKNINTGGRPKNQESFTYWYNYFKNITVKKFLEWEHVHPQEEQTVACSLAYTHMVKARNDLKEYQEIANRTEGMPKQQVAYEAEVITGIKVEIVGRANPNLTQQPCL